MSCRRISGVFFAVVVLLSGSLCLGQTVNATEEDKGVTVTIPGAFKIRIDKQRGFGGRLYDLGSAPDYNLSSGYSGNGLLWVSVSPTQRPKTLGNQFYANPVDKIELLESGPARVLVKLSGRHAAWGQGRRLPGAGFTETFAIYPNGNVYGEYRLVIADQPVSLYYLAMGLVTTGYWGPHGLDQVEAAGEFGPKRFKGPTASSFILQWSEGPDYFTDILLTLYRGRYDRGNFWKFDEGRLLECGNNMDLTSLLPKNPIAPGPAVVIPFMIRLADDMNGPERTSAWAKDYRSPDKLTMRTGQADRSGAGDYDKDGFNEVEGCYVLKADKDVAEFVLHGATIARMSPTFKVKAWQGPAPKAIRLGDTSLAAGRDYSASAADGTLILQIPRTVDKDVTVRIANDIAPPVGGKTPQKARAGETPSVVPRRAPPADLGKVEVSDIVEKLVFDAVEKGVVARPRDVTAPVSHSGCRVALVKDCSFADGQTALKIDVQQDMWKMAIRKIDTAQGTWDGFDYLTFDVYNPQKDMGDLVLDLAGPGVRGRKNKWHKEMLLRPGLNRVEIQLTGAPVDWKQPIAGWAFSQFEMSTSVGDTLYLWNFRLEKGDVRARRPKDAHVVDIDSGHVFHREKP